jgi:hypothetical protein
MLSTSRMAHRAQISLAGLSARKAPPQKKKKKKKEKKSGAWTEIQTQIQNWVPGPFRALCGSVGGEHAKQSTQRFLDLLPSSEFDEPIDLLCTDGLSIKIRRFVD